MIELYLEDHDSVWNDNYGCQVISFPISFFKKINRSNFRSFFALLSIARRLNLNPYVQVSVRVPD